MFVLEQLKRLLTLIYIQKIIGEDQSKKIVIDLSIPNNVSEEVVNNFPIDYICIQDLKILANKNLAFREKEIIQAKKIIDVQLQNFIAIFQQRQIALALKHIPTEIKSIKDRCLNEIFKKEVDSLDPNTLALVEKMLSYMEKKCISLPMKAAIDIVAEPVTS